MKYDIDVIRKLRDQGCTWRECGDYFDTSPENVRWAWRAHSHKTVPAPIFADHDWPEEVPWRDWFDRWSATNDAHKKIDPINETLTIKLGKTQKPIAVALAADLHMGGGFTNHAAIRDTVELILDTPGMYVGVTGDSIEGFLPGMKSAETIEQMPSSVKAQLSALRSMVDELSRAQKLLWHTWGDHDAKWFEQQIGLNIAKQAIHSTVPYFTGRGIIKLELGEQIYYLVVNHAERFSSQWNRNHPQRRSYERFFPGDLIVAAHRHKPAFQVDWHYEQLREMGLQVGGKYIMVACGTFKTGPDPYTIRSWTKGVLGVPTVVFQASEHDMDVFDSPAKAARFL